MSDPDSIFSEEEERLLAAVLDEIVPRSNDGRMPGAGELGVTRYIEQAAQADPGLGTVVKQGLAALQELTRARLLPPFAELARHDRLELLNQLDSSAPAFVPSLIYNTFVGYYQDGRVGEALGIGADPPHPKGYEMPPNDLSLLEAVRKRGKIYRDC